jgi:signal peptidase II
MKKLGLLGVGLVFTLDRALKLLALNKIIKMKKNTGLFFFELSQPWLILLAGIVIAWLIFHLVKRWQYESKAMVIEYLLVIMGGLSNLFDRIVYGYVIDMINFFSYSVFNIADVMILSGCLLIIIKLFKSSYKG